MPSAPACKHPPSKPQLGTNRVGPYLAQRCLHTRSETRRSLLTAQTTIANARCSPSRWLKGCKAWAKQVSPPLNGSLLRPLRSLGRAAPERSLGCAQKSELHPGTQGHCELHSTLQVECSNDKRTALDKLIARHEGRKVCIRCILRAKNASSVGADVPTDETLGLSLQRGRQLRAHAAKILQRSECPI